MFLEHVSKHLRHGFSMFGISDFCEMIPHYSMFSGLVVRICFGVNELLIAAFDFPVRILSHLLPFYK